MNLIELVAELKRLNFEVEVLQNIFSEVDNETDVSEVKIGSRVLIKWGHGGETKGRVVGIRNRDGAFYVHRDGYAGVIGLGINNPDLSEHTLESLSVGAYGKLDQRLWHAQKKLSEIQESIKELVSMNDAQIEQLINNLVT
jgi:hypothetical protein